MKIVGMYKIKKIINKYKRSLILNGVRTAIFNNLTKKEKQLLLKMHDIQIKLGIKIMYDLVIKEIHGVFNIKNPTEEEVWNYKVWFDDRLYFVGDLALNII